MRLTKDLKQAILDHTKQVYPLEACGVVVNKEYIPCKNLSTVKDQFYIDPKDIVRAEAKGVIDAYVHSHPDNDSTPSEPDLVQMNKQTKAWIICGYIPNELEEVNIYKPNGYTLPLLGRQYYHGLQDCYTIIKDYYKRELNINLNDYNRLDNWWQNENTESLYLENFKNEGFIEVSDIRKHDVILFRIGRTYHINHAGIFLEDGSLTSEEAPSVVGNSLFIHHPYDRLSLREVYGEAWNKRKEKVLRHKDLL